MSRKKTSSAQNGPEPFKTLTSKTLVLAAENIDTDQIIPARFLTTTSSDGLGDYAFYDWRFDDAGQPRKSDPLAGHDARSHQILVGGANFGCGSSREHAPWALKSYGFAVVISSKIADIFTSNALNNGLLPITVDEDIHEELLAVPGAELTIDLEACTVSRTGAWQRPFAIARFGRRCLLDGVDPLGFLQNCEADIARYEAGQE